MKKLLIIFFLVITKSAFADDSATLQALFNTGNVVLASGHAYTVSTQINATHLVNMNGASITNTAGTGGTIGLLCGGAITNGTISGTWNYLTPYNIAGAFGIRILCDNAIVSNVHVTKFASYGILCGSVNNPTITGCTIDQIGFIGFYYDPEANKTGGTFSSNLVDRSMIPPANVHQGGVQIRASTSNPAFQITGWTIAGNTIKMPPSPVDGTAECMETRLNNNLTISGNTFIGGSIGCSVVGSKNVSLIKNVVSGQNNEGIEFANDSTSSSNYDKVTETTASQGALLLDGNIPGCNHISLNNDTLTNPANSAIHAAKNTTYLFINGCVLSAHGVGVDIQQSNFTYSTNTTVNMGGFSGTTGYLLDSSPGNLTINAGSIINSTSAVKAFSTGVPALIDNIYGYCVTLTGVTTQFASTFSGGAAYGVNKGFIGNCLISRNVKVIVLP